MRFSQKKIVICGLLLIVSALLSSCQGTLIKPITFELNGQSITLSDILRISANLTSTVEAEQLAGLKSLSEILKVDLVGMSTDLAAAVSLGKQLIGQLQTRAQTSRAPSIPLKITVTVQEQTSK